MPDYRISWDNEWPDPPIILRDAVLERLWKNGQVDFLLADGSSVGWSGKSVKDGMTIELIVPGQND